MRQSIHIDEDGRIVQRDTVWLVLNQKPGSERYFVGRNKRWWGLKYEAVRFARKQDAQEGIDTVMYLLSKRRFAKREDLKRTLRLVPVRHTFTRTIDPVTKPLHTEFLKP